MAIDEATTLLATTRGDLPILDEAGVDDLLEELQCLPLAVSQAGAYMRRMSMTAEEYLSRLKQGKSRWEVLKVSDTDRHRRPEVSNSVLETWRISTERIRVESEISYRILHVIAYVDSQDIPHELLAAAANQFNDGSKNDQADQNPAMQVSELEVLTAVARLKEFSFLRLRQTDDGGRSYDMHKLVREALQYGLGIHSLIENTMDRVLGEDHGIPQAEALYSGRALQVVDGLFPLPETTSWARCEQYLIHAVRVGEWAEVSGMEIKTASMLDRVSYFLYDRGRWRERESVNSRTLGLRRQVLKEKHPDTIRSMAELGATYHSQGRYTEAQDIARKVLEARQEVLGEHPETIRSMADVGVTYHEQGRYDEAKRLYEKALEYRKRVLGEKHPDTIRSIADVGALYYEQGQYEEAEELKSKALQLRQEVLGEHPETIRSLAELGAIYQAQGRRSEAQDIAIRVLKLRQEILGEKHPDTIWSMSDLGTTYHGQGRYNEAKKLKDKSLQLRQEILGEKHPDTMRAMAEVGAIYYDQGRYEEVEILYDEVLRLRQEVLGEKHPDTIRSMASIAATYHQQGRYNQALQLHQTVLDLRRQVLGETHPDTKQSVAYIASTREALQSLTSKQVPKLKGEGKLRDRLSREVMHQKVKHFCKWGSHKGQDIN
ncbi:hypothetical protein ACHAPQ_004939 [Fusarium lateritium]